jgi:hypothetical protein
MSYRLLFLDLDGTLVGRRDDVSPRNLAALKAANDAGCTVVICTARNRYMVEQVASQWTGHGYGIFVNGAVIAEWETGLVLQKIALPSAAVHAAVKSARDFGLGILLFGVHVEDDSGRAVYTDRHSPLHGPWTDLHEHRLVYVDDLLEQNLSPLSIGVYGDRTAAQAIAHAWRAALGGVDVFDTADPKYDGWCAYCNSKQANKAAAAARVGHMLNIPREQIMAIGDHVNDVALLAWAGLGVCMGDGHIDAQSAAAYITSAQHEDGVAAAIERFILGRY